MPLAALYDPLGIVSPILVTVKVLFQEICVAGLDWDIEIPDEMKRHWNAWLLDLKLIKEIIINRCLYGLIGNTQNCTLHGFSDASMKAYSAVIYFVCELNGCIHVKLLTSKTSDVVVDLGDVVLVFDERVSVGFGRLLWSKG